MPFGASIMEQFHEQLHPILLNAAGEDGCSESDYNDFECERLSSFVTESI